MFQLGGNLPPVAKLFGALPRRAAGGVGVGHLFCSGDKTNWPSFIGRGGPEPLSELRVRCVRARSFTLASGLLAALATDGMTAVPKGGSETFRSVARTQHTCWRAGG